MITTSPLLEVIAGPPRDEAAMFAYMLEIGSEYGSQADVLMKSGVGSSDEVPVHSETVHLPVDVMCRYVLLGCVQASAVGGETVIYDSRLAAMRLAAAAPEFANTQVEYRSPHHLGKAAVHPLTAPQTVRPFPFLYRSRDRSNIVRADTLPQGANEDDFYAATEPAVRGAQITAHRWQEGDIVIIDNRKTLHSRNPYQGNRRLLRMRVY